MKIHFTFFVVMGLLLLALPAMAQDVSPTTDATKSKQERDIGGRILLALKYSEPMSAYFNPKILIGSIESDVESGAWGLGLLLDSGIGNKGYKAGIGAGFFGHGYTLGSEYIILAVSGLGLQAVYQKMHDWEHAEIGGELSCSFLLNVYVGAYQELDGDSSLKWRIGGGIGF